MTNEFNDIVETLHACVIMLQNKWGKEVNIVQHASHHEIYVCCEGQVVKTFYIGFKYPAEIADDIRHYAECQ